MRYADTFGMTHDNYRSIWPYRDYLIKAFNTNMPFDEFVKEQIAGDLLPATNIDQIIASGYVRAGVVSHEGGTIPEELRVNNARERTEAYGATFMGLTVGCAVCHDHKYDPTTQKDFYQLTAFFNNLNERPFNGDTPNWAPVIRIPKPQNLEAYNQALTNRAELLRQLNASRLQEQSLIHQWLVSRRASAQPVSTNQLQLRLRLDEGAGVVLKNSAPYANPKNFTIEGSPPQWGETTWMWPDFRMETNTRVVLGQTGDFAWKQPFSCGGWFMLRSDPARLAMKDTGSLISKMDSAQNRGWDLADEKGTISVDLLMDRRRRQSKSRRQSHCRVSGIGTTYSLPTMDRAKLRESGYISMANLSPQRIRSDALTGTIRTTAPMQLGSRYPDAEPLRQTRYQDIRLYGRALTTEEAGRLPNEDYVTEIISKPATQWDRDQWHVVSDFYFNSVDETSRTIHAEIEKIDVQLERLGKGGVSTIVSEEKPTPAYADVLTRGNYLGASGAG